MLYITFVIQKRMSVVSDFICLLDRSVVSDVGLAGLRSVVSDIQRTVVSFFGKMPFVMHRKRLRRFSGWNCKILWYKNQSQPKLMQNEIGIADEKAKTMQRHFQQENNTLQYANDWKICGDSIALLASPYVPTVMYKIVPRLMLVIPLLKIDPASVIGVPVVIFRPCILPSGSGFRSIDVFLGRRRPGHVRFARGWAGVALRGLSLFRTLKRVFLFLSSFLAAFLSFLSVKCLVIWELIICEKALAFLLRPWPKTRSFPLASFAFSFSLLETSAKNSALVVATFCT